MGADGRCATPPSYKQPIAIRFPFCLLELSGSLDLFPRKRAPMTAFYFNTRDNDGVSPGDSPFEYPTLMDAIEQAKKVLAEMALDGIPDGSGRRLSVELESADHQPIVTVSIELKVEYSENRPNLRAH